MPDKITTDKLSILQNLGYSGDDSLDSLMLAMNDIHNKDGTYSVEPGGDAWWMEVKDRQQNKAKEFVDCIADELEGKLKAKAKAKGGGNGN